MQEKDRNEMIELFGKIFGESIVNEIKKYEKKHNEEEAENYSDDLKAIKKIVDNAVDDICRYIGTENGLLFEKLDKIIDILDTLNNKIYTPWTTPQIYPNTPQIYPYTPDPLNPLGPVITYGVDDDRVTLTTTGDQGFPATHTYSSLTAEDIEDVIYSMFGQ